MSRDELHALATEKVAGIDSNFSLAWDARDILNGGALFVGGKGYPLSHEERIPLANIYLDRIIEIRQS